MIRRTLVALAAVVAVVGFGGAASAATGWSSVTVPSPSTAAENSFSGISCPTASFCMAVGTASSSPAASSPIAETFNGRAWTVVHPKKVGSGSGLEAVDCTSATVCTVVGYGASQPLAERWNGHTWRVEATVKARYGGSFSGVSCPTASLCEAVGDQYPSKTQMGSDVLAEKWQGLSRGWSVTATPSLAPYQGASLSAVSCASPTHCVAAGGKLRYLSGDGQYNLVETWNGKSWSLTAVPWLNGVNSLSGIVCRSTTWCLAVGKTGDGSGQPATLLLQAGKWKVGAVPTFGGDFLSVACRSTTSCLGAGLNLDGTGGTIAPLVEHWNGSGWAVRSVSEPNSQDAQLPGVSCASSTSCYAVGSYEPTSGGSTSRVLVERGSPV